MTQLEEVEAAERRMDVHYLRGDGYTECGRATVGLHWTAKSDAFDCADCARVFVARTCFDADPKSCPAHARAAALAYPKMEVVR